LHLQATNAFFPYLCTLVKKLTSLNLKNLDMKLKGLVWIFTILLTLLSLWELSYTWVVRSHENKIKDKVTSQLKSLTANMQKDDKEALIKEKTLRYLDSTKEKEIYPLVGTSYQKCKEYELNLGLDLQGGMSVTMDVSLINLLTSLSNNPKDATLKRALDAASAEKLSSDANYVDLFTKNYINQNGAGKLAALFSGPNKDVKIGDDDKGVTSKLKETANGAIKQTYKILQKRIDKFGVAQPNLNLDENKGVITVELAGITNPERVRKFLTSSANLQFWSPALLRDNAFGEALSSADKALSQFLKADAASRKDTSIKIGEAILSSVMQFSIDPKTGQSNTPYIGIISKQDTAKLNSYLRNEIFATQFGSNYKIMYGIEQKNKVGNYFEVYAVEKINGLEKAPLEGDGISEAYQSYNQEGKPSVKMDMTPAGSRTWANLTEKNIGRFVTISLDDQVYSSPSVKEKIEGGTEISGSFTVEEAQDLSNVLKSGKLDASPKIVAENVIGATIGEEGLTGGRNAFLIAFAVIFILMLVYYNTGGWVANIALILNLLFTIGVLASLGLTLTAAGIAGLVLTIGLAVDTNVIIFERIKEELTKGKSYPAAVAEGYKKSLAPVLDAHVTSLLTALILFYFGLGPVLGFATTQIIGILLSLFCGILVSRLITDLRTDKNHHLNYFTALSRKIFQHANYKFIEKRKIAYVISAIVLSLGVASFFNGFNLGVEFVGGRSYNVEFDRALKNSDVAADLTAAFKDGTKENAPVIKTYKDNKHLNITTSYLRGVDNADLKVQTQLFEGLKKVLPAGITFDQFTAKHLQSSTTIQPSISDDLKRGAWQATLFSMIAIFIYIFIRFRDWRYSAGTIVTLIHDVLVTFAVFSFLKNVVNFPLEIDQHFIAAVLTVIGFSMNDTVIVFDRIREYSRDMKGDTKTNIINRAINDTLSRTIMTSLTVFLTLLILFIFGGEATKGFAFAMMVGVITGTYSSIFVGAPILVDFAKDKPLGAARDLTAKVKEVAPDL
jgi:SecD/SecF fusion protein